MNTEKTCTITTYTDQSLVIKKGAHYEITVYWNLEVNEDAIVEKFNSFKHKVDMGAIKNGVGQITVEVIRNGNGTPRDVINLVEPLIHLYVVHQNGLNAFNMNSAQGIPMNGLTCKISNHHSIDALNACTMEERKKLPSELHWLASAFEPMKAFIYGNKFDHEKNSEWVQPFLKGEKNCDYYKISNLGNLRYMPIVTHKIGNIHVTSLAITEFLELPLSQEIIAQKGIQALRFPYVNIKNNITTQYTWPLPDTHNHTMRLKDKFGEKCIALSHQGFIIDLKKMEEKFEPQYKVLGFRQFYSPKVVERLKQGGFIKS